MLNLFASRKTVKTVAERLYAAAVSRSREPVFFVTFGVSDTLDGRFDLLTLHAVLVLTQLKTNPVLAQAFIDRLFTGFDEALRELGAGDMGLGAKLKRMGNAFHGRLKAYEEAQDEAAMSEALSRNLFRGAPCAPQMTAYVLGAKQHLALTEEGEVDFGPLPFASRS